MRAVKWSIGERNYCMAYTVDAMLDLQDIEPGINELLAKMSENTREGISLLVQAVQILTRAGELARRAAGYDVQEIPSEEEIRRVLTPKDRVKLINAAVMAIERGMLTEIDSDEEVDLYLLEIEKKTEIRVEERKPTE